MLQKIKYHLFKIFLTQKKKLALFACLIFLGLFAVSQPAHAFILDLANVQLDALDFIDNSILKWLVFFALLAIESITLLIASANLLDWSSSLPVGLDNGLVKAGWGFTSDLANLFFILIFIVIALAYILKLDNFKMKQALPRLIIIALLINFSLLFVKMLADAGWIFQNSFRSVFFEGGTGFATAAIESLKASSYSLIAVVAGIPLAYLAVALIPYANIIALVTIATMVLSGGGGALIGPISQTIMVIVFNFTVGLIFLIFAALFLIRIAAIWLLAIFAPLAFMAFILPSTKKYFDQWMKALVQWVFLGIIAFFLVGLGIKLFGLVAPDTGQQVLFDKNLGGWKFFDTFYKYIFLIIYLVVVLGACKKLVPVGTQMIWGFSEMAVNRGGKWMGERARRVGLEGISRERAGALMATQRLEALQGKTSLTAGERLSKGWWTARKLGRSSDLLKSEKRMAETTLMVDEREKLLKKLPKDPDDRRAFLEAELSRMERRDPLGVRRGLDRPKIGAIGDLIQKEGKFGSVSEKFIEDMIRGGTNPDKILEKRPDLAQRITGLTDPDKIKKMKEELQTDLRKQNLSSQEFQKKLNEKTEQKLIEEVMSKIKPEDLGKRMQTEAAKNAYVVEQILRDQTKLNDFSRNAKVEVKKAIYDTIIKNPKMFNQSPLKEKAYSITQSPRWPVKWQEPAGKTTPAGASGPQTTSRPERTPRPKRQNP